MMSPMPTLRRRDSNANSKRRTIIGLTVAALVLVLVGAGVFYDKQRATTADGEYESTFQAPTPEPPAAAGTFEMPADPRLLILGDSYTEGYAADPLSNGYAYTVTKQLGWPSQVDGIGDSGFTWGGGPDGNGGNDYLSRINRRAEAGGFAPNILLLQGGQSDYRAESTEVYDKVRQTIDAARAAWPDVQVIILGPSQPQPGGNLLDRVATPMGQAALSTGAAFINPIAQRWLTEQNSEGYSAADGTQLNTEGHVYMASRLITALGWIGVPIV
ncbi:Lipolytic protein G-D-S-L family [Rhodococcus sp. AW25M09]|nr:Lipolytic protein G-D-S-L family [Rhodococcus sp. AW25M09]